LANLTNLTKLRIFGTQLNDISPLANLTSLTELYLSNNQLSDISPLANLTSLNWLFLNNNQLTDLNGLVGANLPSLRELVLYHNQIIDLNGLAGVSLPYLRELGLSHNQISDISGLADVSLPYLQALDLSHNQIRDISPLVNNGGIKGNISLQDNPLNKTSILTHVPALKARGNSVRFNYPVGWDIIDIGDAPVNNVVFELDAESVYVNLVANVTVKLVDSKNRLIRGETVSLAVDLGTLGPLTDNGNGSFTAKYTAPEIHGEARITAVANNSKYRGQLNFYLVDTSVEISAERASLAASLDTTIDLGIQVTDTRDNLVKGQKIKLTTDLGTVSTPTDNGDGTFSAKYTAVDTIGNATITVETDDGKSAYTSITLLRVVSNAEELKDIKAKKIIWKKDGTEMVLIPSTAKIVRKSTFDRLGDPIVKAVEIKGPNPVPFYMD